MEKTGIKKIVVIGPESTGKTVLCEKLAAHFKTKWVREYAREYLLRNGSDYRVEDLMEVAKGQVETEAALIQQTLLEYPAGPGKLQPVFIDTDLYVIKVWSEFVFNKCDNRILNGIVAQHCDLYLLCQTDLPWVKDELREYPDLENRAKLFHYYRDAMICQHTPWVEISGTYDERLQKAIHAVNKIL